MRLCLRSGLAGALSGLIVGGFLGQWLGVEAALLGVTSPQLIGWEYSGGPARLLHLFLQGLVFVIQFGSTGVLLGAIAGAVARRPDSKAIKVLRSTLFWGSVAAGFGMVPAILLGMDLPLLPGLLKGVMIDAGAMALGACFGSLFKPCLFFLEKWSTNSPVRSLVGAVVGSMLAVSLCTWLEKVSMGYSAIYIAGPVGGIAGATALYLTRIDSKAAG
jgi:hypothetical protein